MLGVRFSYVTLTANLAFLEDADLVALLGNLLDNAVEAAQSADDKWIELSVESKVAGVTALTCENSASCAPTVRGGTLQTTKENAAHHGIGIKSIVRTAKNMMANLNGLGMIKTWCLLQKSFLKVKER